MQLIDGNCRSRAKVNQVQNSFGQNGPQNKLKTVSTFASVALRALVGLLVAASPQHVLAQSEPVLNGARILRQVEPSRSVTPDARARKKVVVEEPTEPTGPTVLVNRFDFRGNSAFSSDQLADILRGMTGRKLTISELRYAADLIGKFYQDNGVLARAVVPAQDVEGGTLRIDIVESRLSEVSVDSGAEGSVSVPSTLAEIIRAGLGDGDVINLRQVERGTLLANRLPGVSVRTVLRAGASDGTSAVVIVPGAHAANRFTASIDRSGSSRAGYERLIVNASLFPVARFGDELALTALASRGVQYARAAYSAPVGTDGLTLGLSASGLRYDLLKTPVPMKGNSQSVVGTMQYPFVLQSDMSTTISIEGGYRRFSDTVATLSTNRSLAYVSWGVDMSGADDVLAGGSNAVGANLLIGRTFGQSRYARLSAYFVRRQSVTTKDAIELRLSGQVGSTNLDQSQLMMINGVNGVHAFTNDDDVSGRSGLVGRASYERTITGRLGASLFYEAGRVGNATAGRPDSLKGYGAGVVWRTPIGLIVDAQVARAIDAPAAFASKTRAWFSARMAF